MGACCSATYDENTIFINQKLQQEDYISRRTNKLLFLGPGGSGKSTIFKQLQWLHGGGFTDEDAMMLKEHIYCQIIQQMKQAIKHFIPQYINNGIVNTNGLTSKSPHHGSITNNVTYSGDIDTTVTATTTTTESGNDHKDDNNPISSTNNIDTTVTAEDNNSTTTVTTTTTTESGNDHKEDNNNSTTTTCTNNNELTLSSAISTVQNHGDVTVLTDEVANAIKFIWQNEEKIKNIFEIENFKNVKNKNKILDETTEYFWNSIDRVRASDYRPNEKDIINVRYRTTGVIEKNFEINSAKFHIFDVGGQKSERKKWINCFDEVKAVIFVISLSCYNEMMYEDLNKNCMVDSLELFNDICNNKHFNSTHIILFLNKKDLFEKKIVNVPITACPAFEDFTSYNHQTTIHSNPNDYEQTTSYIKFKFESLNENNKRKQIYSHLTCAMDKKNIDAVFNDVKHIVITTNLFNEGLS